MLFGVDINQKAIDFVQSLGIEAMVCSNIFDFIPDEKFDLIITTHVMEHLPKDKIIPALAHFKNHILKPGGKIFVAVPNAQSHTGCYWAYEDFTHNTLFTAGSLIYVLKMAGFSQVEIIDPQAMAGTRGVKRLLRKIFLRLYEFQYSFWNRMTSSAFHAPSPKVFSYEIKALAANQDNSIKDKHENTAKTAAF